MIIHVNQAEITEQRRKAESKDNRDAIILGMLLTLIIGITLMGALHAI